jgi:Cu/Ag efflux protein CusF
MKPIACLSAAIACALALSATAQTTPPANPPQVMDAIGGAELVTLTAKIEAVDLANRVVTVKGPQGRVVDLKVGDQVKNLAQVKAGDEIVLKYTRAVSVKLEKNVAGRSETVTSTGPMAAPAGGKPGVAAAQQTVIVANVDSVDPKQQTVVLQGPKGRYVEVKVKDPAVFKDVKAGDKVQVTYTDAMVVDVVTPKK